MSRQQQPRQAQACSLCVQFDRLTKLFHHYKAESSGKVEKMDAGKFFTMFCCLLFFFQTPVLKNSFRVSGPGPEVIKPFSYSTQLSTKFILHINVKMPTIVGILTFVIA